MPGRSKRKAEEANLEDDRNWSRLKVVELKTELETRGLATTGKKADLVERLEEDDAGETGEIPNHAVVIDAPAPAPAPTPAPATAPASASAPAPASAVPPKSKLTKEPAKKAEKAKKVGKTGWNAKSATALKEECKDRDISTGGTKADLVTRLDDDDIERAIVNDPSYVPRRDENAIASGETRNYPFMSRPDNDFRERDRKAKKERMIMLGRNKGVDKNGVANETFDIAGSSGSMYSTTIGCIFKCDCPDFKFRQIRCKHVVYALVIILKVPTEVACQRALIPSEVKEIFDRAPVTQELHFDIHEEPHPGVRKPIDGDCPICVYEFEESDDLLWCKAACGQNVHRTCFEQWKAAKIGYGDVKCVYCRSTWVEGGSNEGLESMKKTAPKIGWYKNIAHLDVYKNALAGSQE